MIATKISTWETQARPAGCRAPNALHACGIIGSKSTMDLELYMVTIYGFNQKKKERKQKNSAKTETIDKTASIFLHV